LNINSSITVQNLTRLDNANCPDYFYEILNQTIVLITVDNNENDNDNVDPTVFCQQSSNYGTYLIVGPYPAIYYFGQSIQATLLTTFFTLFGVIGDGTPVSI
jgi:hypothetical protein